MADPVRVLLVDRPTLFRASLRALLRRRNLRVVGEAENGLQAASQAGVLHPDVAVVDPAVPEGGPFMIASLRDKVRDCGVLVLSDDGDENAVKVALLAGARGYLHKDCAPDDLVRAIHSVRAGELVLAPRVTSVIMRAADPARLSGAGPAGLTLREVDVLRLVAHGCQNAEIARALFVSEHTVKAHLANMLSKLGLRNRVELVTFAFQRGLVRAEECVLATSTSATINRVASHRT